MGDDQFEGPGPHATRKRAAENRGNCRDHLRKVSGSGRQLDRFVDIRLLPFVERLIGSRLTDAVTAAVAELKAAFGSQELDEAQQEWILKSTFRLLAAKILKDKRVYGFITLDLRNLDDFSSESKSITARRKGFRWEGLGGVRRSPKQPMSSPASATSAI